MKQLADLSKDELLTILYHVMPTLKSFETMCECIVCGDDNSKIKYVCDNCRQNDTDTPVMCAECWHSINRDENFTEVLLCYHPDYIAYLEKIRTEYNGICGRNGRCFKPLNV